MNNQNINNDEINIKDVLHTLNKYRIQIVLSTLVFTFLAIGYAYSKQNIYQSSATLQLINEESDSKANDIVLKSFGKTNNSNIDNEKEVLMSRFLAKKTSGLLNLRTRYFTKNNFKTKELYKNAPFVVNIDFIDEIIFDKRVILTPIDEERFNLKIKPTPFLSKRGFLGFFGLIQLYDSDEISYNADHNYDEIIKTSLFQFTIQRISSLTNEIYSFSFLDDESIYRFIQYGINVSPAISEFSTILNISFQDSVSLRAKDVVNAHIAAYIEQEIEYKSSISNLTLDFIDKQLDKINSRLTTSEKNLVKYKTTNEVVDLGDKVSSTSRKLAKYETDLQELEIEENILVNLQQYLITNQDLTGLTVGSVNFADPALSSLIRKLQELVEQRSTLLLDYTNLHPDVIKTGQTLLTLKRSIRSALDNNLRQMSQRKNSLKKIINKYSKSLETLPEQERELSRLSRYFDVNERIYSFLLEKRAEAAIMRSSTIASSRVLDEALNNYVPIRPKRVLIVLAGLLFGLIFGVVIAFLKEYLNNMVKSSDDIEKLTSIPLYGVVPLNKNRKTQTIFIEAFKTIRTNLQFLPKNEKNQIISITSSVSGEGKTKICAKLAEVIGQAHKRVLVIDMDLRKASIHKEFDLENDLGMSNYLTGQCSLKDIIIKTAKENIDLISTGPLPPNPSELILTEEMKKLLSILRDKYDYIIIDTPPIGLVTDAMILINYSDISFLVARSEYTRKEFVKSLDKMMEKHKHNHIGMILNGVDMSNKFAQGVSYGYGYKNENYYTNRSY